MTVGNPMHAWQQHPDLRRERWQREGGSFYRVKPKRHAGDPVVHNVVSDLQCHLYVETADTTQQHIGHTSRLWKSELKT